MTYFILSCWRLGFKTWEEGVLMEDDVVAQSGTEKLVNKGANILLIQRGKRVQPSISSSLKRRDPQ